MGLQDRDGHYEAQAKRDARRVSVFRVAHLLYRILATGAFMLVVVSIWNEWQSRRDVVAREIAAIKQYDDQTYPAANGTTSAPTARMPQPARRRTVTLLSPVAPPEPLQAKPLPHFPDGRGAGSLPKDEQAFKALLAKMVPIDDEQRRVEQRLKTYGFVVWHNGDTVMWGYAEETTACPPLGKRQWWYSITVTPQTKRVTDCREARISVNGWNPCC